MIKSTCYIKETLLQW